MAIIAPDYLDTFKGYYDLEFVELIGTAISEQGRSFFPTIGDLKKIEMGQRPYNPYGGSGSLPFAESVMRELSDRAKEPSQDMSEENKKLLAKFLKKIGDSVEYPKDPIDKLIGEIGEEMPKGESG